MLPDGNPENNFYKNILDNLYEGVYFCDSERKITYWNRAAEILTGFKREDIINTACWDNVLMHTDLNGNKLCGTETCPALRAMREGRMIEEEVYLRHKEGYRVPVVTRISPIRNDEGKVIGAIEIFSDNSAKVAAFKKIEKLEALAFIDQLTGVGNRRYTEIKIGSKLEEFSRYAWVGEFGVLFFDLDHFKKINDTYGHATGDLALKVAAKTVLNNLREEDFIGRWGGEEFVAIISNVDRKKLLSIAEKLRGLVHSSSFLSGKDEIRISISVGATLSRRDDSLESIVRRADRLMYECKNSGRNCVTIG